MTVVSPPTHQTEAYPPDSTPEPRSNTVERPAYPRRLNLAAAGLLLLLALVFMLPGLPPLRTAAPAEQLLVFPPWKTYYPDLQPRFRGGDIILQQLPWHHWMQDEILAGRFPLWASGPLGGQPLFANYQAAVLYPLHLLWALVPTGAGFGIVMALKLWLAGLGMWLFLRSMDLRPWVALTGALGYEFSAGMVVWLPWANTNVQLLMPWLAWAAYAWCVKRNRAALPGLAALLALAIFAGHPELLFIIGIAVGVWSITLMLTEPRRRLLPAAVGLAAALAVGLAIGAVQLLPFLEVVSLSHINAIRHPGSGLARLHVDAGMILDWVLPRSWGQLADGVIGGTSSFTEVNNYVGLAALFGVPLAFVGVLRRQIAWRMVLPWVIVAAFGWIVAYDDTVGTTIRSLPGFNQSVNGRWVLAIGFSLLVLGALGWDWLARRVEERGALGGSRGRTLGWVGLALVGGGAAIMLAHFAGLFPAPDLGPMEGPWQVVEPSYGLYWAAWAVGVAAVTLGAGLIWWVGGRASRWMPGVLAAVLVADLWVLLYTYNPSVPAEWYYPRTSFINQLAAAVPSPERVIVQGEILPPNSALVYNVRDFRGQDPMISERAFRTLSILSPSFEKEVWNWYNSFLPDLNLQMAPALGVRYYVLPTSINLTSTDYDVPGKPDFKRLAFKDGAGLWEAEGVPGYAYLTDNVRAVANGGEAEKWLAGLTWGAVRSYEAAVEAPASAIAGLRRGPAGTSPGTANVTEYRPGYVRLEVEAARPALVVAAESYYPGWHAALDSQPAGLLRANYLSQGVMVPEGRHVVELRYEPDGVRYGALITIAGLLGLAGLALWARRREEA